jgi:hypothetical protein
LALFFLSNQTKGSKKVDDIDHALTDMSYVILGINIVQIAFLGDNYNKVVQ